MLKHLCDMHFACNHTPLVNMERNDWFSPTDSDFAVLREVLLDKSLLKSFQYYVNFR